MESNGIIKENEVSGPLQHLLSLKWETLPDISTVTNNVEMDIKSPTKQVKRVRFSDKVEQNFVDSYDIESNVDEDECNDSMFSDNELINNNNEDIDISTLDLETDNEQHFQDYQDLENYSNDFEDEDLNIHKNDFDFMEKIENNSHQDLASYIANSNDVNKNETFSELDLSTEVEPTVQAELNSEDQIVREMALIEIEDKSLPQTDDHDNFINVHDIKKRTELLSNPVRCSPKHCQKQTKKINSLLNNTAHQFSSVPELKSKVVEAWSTVKKKKHIILKKNDNKKDEKLTSISKPISKRNYTSLKVSNVKKRKAELNIVKRNSVNQNLPLHLQKEQSKSDKEETEMAFKSWKKHKDEMLRKEAAKKFREKEQQTMSLLMNEQVKKDDAESAYLAWVANKAESCQKEKMKKKWLMGKDQEATELKMQRDKQALEMYNIWLENKYTQRNNFSSYVEYKPPWIPPPHG